MYNGKIALIFRTKDYRAFIKYTDKDKLIHSLIVLRKLFDAIIALVNQIETPHSFLFCATTIDTQLAKWSAVKLVVCVFSVDMCVCMLI